MVATWGRFGSLEGLPVSVGWDGAGAGLGTAGLDLDNTGPHVSKVGTGTRTTHKLPVQSKGGLGY